MFGNSVFLKFSCSYKLKEYQLHAVTFGGLLYSLYVTLLTIITTVRFKSDLQAFIEGICSSCLTVWNNVLIGANIVSDIFNKIPNEIVVVALEWKVKLLYIVLVLALIIGGASWIISKIIQFYSLRLADKISVVVLLVSFSLLVLYLEMRRC